MAQITYSDLQNSVTESTNTTSPNRVGYFSLPNNGDTAIVRIMHDSPDTFEIVSVHSTYVDGKFRKINCLRNGYGSPIDSCPLCVKDAEHNTQDPEHKTYPSNRIYIRMLQYIKDENGNVVVKPVVWDRPAKKYSDKLVSYMQEYGNLSDMIFKIKRNGMAGDTNTDYEFIPANQQVYPSNIYIKDTSLFDGYSVLNGAVLNKDYDDLAYFAKYDSFPDNGNNNGWDSSEVSGIPFDAPEANKMADDIMGGFDSNGIPQWNVNTPTTTMNNTSRPAPTTFSNTPQMNRPVR